MAKECPVGTIHIWGGDTEMIKAHSPFPPYSNGWIPLRTNPRLDLIGKECDNYGRDIVNYKLPINGEKFLDHEIDEFGEKEGLGFFKSGNFKAYEGWYGSGHYAFRNEFSRMFMSNVTSLDEAIVSALVEANEAAGGDKHNDKLTPEQKKVIRADIRRDFKEDPAKIDDVKASQLLEIIKRTRQQIEEGLDFKDPEKKKMYEEFKTIVDSLPESYELISEKRQQRLKAVDMIEDTFPDNWGVRESCKDYAQKKFDEYVRLYADRISNDSLQEQMEMFGVTMDMEPDEFYKKIYRKATATKNYDYLDKYVGKEIRFAGETKRYKVTKENGVLYVERYGMKMDLIEILEGNQEHLSAEYDEFGGGFKDLVYLRFMKRYDKSIEGEWTLDQLPAIHNLENLANELPAGHFKTNDELHLITNKSYAGGDRGGYAWYNAGEKRINLSAECIARSTVWGVLQSPTEFKSVMLHEIGHSIDAKIKGPSTYNYKKFVVDCGWTYQSEDIRHGRSATGNQKDIARTGSNSSTTLITEYSKKSPSEAFAEYYSFYNLNKKHFDKYFATGDKRYLQTDTKVIAKSVPSEQKIKQMLGHKLITPDSDRAYEIKINTTGRVRTRKPGETTPVVDNPTIGALKVLQTYNEVTRTLSDKGQDHNITLTNPWKMSLSTEEQQKYNPKDVGVRKNFSIHSMPPLVVVKDGLNRVVIDGGVRMEVARMNRQLAPCIEISKEEYYSLREHGLNDKQISDCVYTKHGDDWVPKQIAPAVKVHGLIYRDELIPLDVILDNHDGIKTMKDICESKVLQKALVDLFGKSESLEKARSGIYDNTEENRKLGRVGQKYGEKNSNDIGYDPYFENKIGSLILQQWIKRVPEEKWVGIVRSYVKKYIGVSFEENKFLQIYNRLKEETLKNLTSEEKPQEEDIREKYIKERDALDKHMKASSFVNPNDITRMKELTSLIMTEGESKDVRLGDVGNMKNPKRVNQFGWEK